MSFWTTLEADVNAGLEAAAVIVGDFFPNEATLLEDIAAVVQTVETIFSKPVAQVPANVTSMAIKNATTMSVIKQAQAAKVKR